MSYVIVFWLAIAVVLIGAVVVAWLVDRHDFRGGLRRRRGSDGIWSEIREANRDSRVMNSLFGTGSAGTSWTDASRRNRDGKQGPPRT